MLSKSEAGKLATAHQNCLYKKYQWDLVLWSWVPGKLRPKFFFDTASFSCLPNTNPMTQPPRTRTKAAWFMLFFLATMISLNTHLPMLGEVFLQSIFGSLFDWYILAQATFKVLTLQSYSYRSVTQNLEYCTIILVKYCHAWWHNMGKLALVSQILPPVILYFLWWINSSFLSNC